MFLETKHNKNQREKQKKTDRTREYQETRTIKIKLAQPLTLNTIITGNA